MHRIFQGPKPAAPTLSRIKVKTLGGSCSKWTKMSLQTYYSQLGAKNAEVVKSRFPHVARNRDQISVMLWDHVAQITGEAKGCSELQCTCKVLQLCSKVLTAYKKWCSAQPSCAELSLDVFQRWTELIQSEILDPGATLGCSVTVMSVG